MDMVERSPSGMTALFFATPRESRCALDLLQGITALDSPRGLRLFVGSQCGASFLILVSGVGKVSAAAATAFLMERHRPAAIVLLGTAGSLNQQLRLGDLIIAEGLVPGDVGVCSSRGFSPTGPGTCEGERVLFHPSFPTSEMLSDTAARAAASALLPFHRGMLLTCDQVVLDRDLRTHLGSETGALAVEMEGAAVAQVARQYGDPPLAVIRSVSDELEHDFPDLDKVLPYRGQSRADLWTRRARLILSDPLAANRLRDLQKGMDLALENLRIFLKKMLPLLAGQSHR